MIYLGLLGLDPEGPVMSWFQRFRGTGRWFGWINHPVFLAVFINGLINTMTDGIGAAGDPSSSFVGITFGCLCVMIMLPIAWRLKD